MAHYCPDCSLLCHCGGDIDDVPFENARHEALCSHCDGRNDDDPPDYEDYDEEAGGIA